MRSELHVIRTQRVKEYLVRRYTNFEDIAIFNYNFAVLFKNSFTEKELNAIENVLTAYFNFGELYCCHATTRKDWYDETVMTKTITDIERKKVKGT